MSKNIYRVLMAEASKKRRKAKTKQIEADKLNAEADELERKAKGEM